MFLTLELHHGQHRTRNRPPRFERVAYGTTGGSGYPLALVLSETMQGGIDFAVRRQTENIRGVDYLMLEGQPASDTLMRRLTLRSVVNRPAQKLGWHDHPVHLFRVDKKLWFLFWHHRRKGSKAQGSCFTAEPKGHLKDWRILRDPADALTWSWCVNPCDLLLFHGRSVSQERLDFLNLRLAMALFERPGVIYRGRGTNDGWRFVGRSTGPEQYLRKVYDPWDRRRVLRAPKGRYHEHEHCNFRERNW